jgi:2-aminoethylphosphonate-pyruvate transaminase
VANGAYGLRQTDMARMNGIPYTLLEYDDDTHPSLEAIGKALDGDPNLSVVACVHSETTSGIINNIDDIGSLVKVCMEICSGIYLLNEYFVLEHSTD